MVWHTVYKCIHTRTHNQKEIFSKYSLTLMVGYCFLNYHFLRIMNILQNHLFGADFLRNLHYASFSQIRLSSTCSCVLKPNKFQFSWKCSQTTQMLRDTPTTPNMFWSETLNVKITSSVYTKTPQDTFKWATSNLRVQKTSSNSYCTWAVLFHARSHLNLWVLLRKRHSCSALETSN